MTSPPSAFFSSVKITVRYRLSGILFSQKACDFLVNRSGNISTNSEWARPLNSRAAVWGQTCPPCIQGRREDRETASYTRLHTGVDHIHHRLFPFLVIEPDLVLHVKFMDIRITEVLTVALAVFARKPSAPL